MASMEVALAALSEVAGMGVAVFEAGAKPEVANPGSVAAWEGDVAGAAVAKGETPGAGVALG